MALTDAIAAALEDHGLRALELEVITAPDPRKRGRSLHRAHLDDGSSVKVRSFEAADLAAEQVRLRAAAPAGFAPALGAHGPIVIETWIDGSPAVAPLEADQATAAGDLLASLHVAPLGPPSTTSGWVEIARADLATLQDAGAIDAEAAIDLDARLTATDPGAFVPCLIHRDFCAANLVVGDDGALWVIDNEWFTAGPAGFDVGRTRNRWWMTDAEAAAFTAGYEAQVGRPADEDFWGLLADLFGARVELVMNPEPGTPILDQLLARVGRPPT